MKFYYTQQHDSIPTLSILNYHSSINAYSLFSIFIATYDVSIFPNLIDYLVSLTTLFHFSSLNLFISFPPASSVLSQLTTIFQLFSFRFPGNPVRLHFLFLQDFLAFKSWKMFQFFAGKWYILINSFIIIMLSSAFTPLSNLLHSTLSWCCSLWLLFKKWLIHIYWSTNSLINFFQFILN